MSRKGNCYDKRGWKVHLAPLKNALIHHQDYHTREQARSEIFEYIELFYNRQRIHQSLNYQTPVKYERTKRVA
jgi:transposase InsO family protein